MHVPQRWFNAYAGNRGETNGLFADPMEPQSIVKLNSIKEGDLLVHHAGHKSLRAQRMSPWMDVAERHLPQWELNLNETTYVQEIEDFWKNSAPMERMLMDDLIRKEAQKEIDKAKKMAKTKSKSKPKPSTKSKPSTTKAG